MGKDLLQVTARGALQDLRYPAFLRGGMTATARRPTMTPWRPRRHVHAQADLGGRRAAFALSATGADRRRLPCHGRIQSDRQRTTGLEHVIAAVPGPGLADWGVGVLTPRS